MPTEDFCSVGKLRVGEIVRRNICNSGYIVIVWYLYGSCSRSVYAPPDLAEYDCFSTVDRTTGKSKKPVPVNGPAWFRYILFSVHLCNVSAYAQHELAAPLRAAICDF